MPRDVKVEDVIIETLLNIHDSYKMDEDDLQFVPEQAGMIRRTVRCAVTYMWKLELEEKNQLISEINPEELPKLSCVMNKGLAESFKVVNPTKPQIK